MQGVSLPRQRTAVAKFLFVVVILLLCVQYLVNMIVYRKDHSTILTVINYALEYDNGSADLLRQLVTQSTEKPLELCPLIPPDIKGRVTVNVQIPAWAYVEEQNQELSLGGRYKPEDCVARNKVAIIIPYRDREIHLKIFLQNIHPFLRSQQLDYAVFVVELAPNVPFNRAALMNIGFLEASKLYDYHCFIFHDVDLLPEDDRNLYVCPSMPRHMSAAIDKLKYKLPYPQIFGGVSAISKDHFVKINGFSNLFFGWGGEDDDMYKRILYSNLTVIRYSTEVARYKMLSHVKDKGNPQRFKMLKSTRARRLLDGINSLKYTRLKLEFRPLYTWIYVTLNKTEILHNKDILARVNAVHALLAKRAQEQKAKKAQEQKAKKTQEQKVNNAAQKHKAPQGNTAQTKKPVQKQGETKIAQNIQGSSHSVKPKSKQIHQQKLAEAKRAQELAQRKNAQDMLAAQAQRESALAKLKKQVPGFFKSPQFISWVPTNGTVPANLTIEERLGPKRMVKKAQNTS